MSQTSVPTSVLTKKQFKTFGPRPIDRKEGYGQFATMVVTVRYDDECGNGRNSFSVTADIRNSVGVSQGGGSCHDLIMKYFPELKKYVKWHLCASDEPMYYVKNTVYLAGDRDCWGLRKGEFQQFKDKHTGKPLWRLNISYDLYQGHVAADEKPAPVTIEYVPWGREGEGKERELDAARRTAIWPDATDEELTAPGLEERLMSRLPKLMEEFKAAVEELGFTY